MRDELEPDAAWVLQLAGRAPGEVSKAMSAARSERWLLSHLRREHRLEGRRGYGEILAPLELYALTRLLHPLHVVEVGVSSGVSSAYLLQAMERNDAGTLHSVDLPLLPSKRSSGRVILGDSWSLPSGRSSGWAVPLPLKKRWDLRLGDKAEVIPLLARELPTIDMIVYDVPHGCRGAGLEFRRLDPRLPRGAVVIVDHGPGGGLCPALGSWARQRGVRTVQCRGTGLYGMGSAKPSRGAGS